MSPFYLDPKQAVDVEPLAERNVERVSDTCLDINGKSRAVVVGRGGGAWWMIWMGMGCLIPSLVVPPFCSEPSAVYAASLTAAALSTSIFGVSLFVWPLRVWRTHQPMRFSRKTRKVYFHWKGKTYVEDWDRIRAYVKIQTGVVGTGAPIIDPQVNIEFQTGRPQPVVVYLLGNEAHGTGYTIEQRALSFWEYIRRYMEDGPEGLPAPDLDTWHPVERKDLLTLDWPFPVYTSSEWHWRLVEIALLPLRVGYYVVSMPTEIVYYYFERRLKPVPFPPDLLEASTGETVVHYTPGWPVRSGAAEAPTSQA